MPDFTLLDYVALAWFVLCWVGYTWFADKTRWHNKSVTAAMAKHRCRWMRMMLRREQRIVDSNIQSILLHGVAFFASTTILLVGGLLAALGATDRAIQVLSDLPLAVQTSQAVWELKVLLLVAIFVYAFFKLAWSFRLFNYCAILIGAAPEGLESDEEIDAYTKQIANLNSLAAGHFNQGLRAYFYALAALGWFLHPVLFMVLTAWITVVLQRREFRSRSFRLLRDLD